jgi:hypothetical protein
MAKTKMVPPADEHAVSFLGFAEQYQKAANLLCDSDKMLGMPIYFMFAHAIELALKAYLRVANVPIVADKKRRRHKITELFKECQTLGLKVGPDDVTNMGNVVALLDGANEEQGLRYFRTKGATYPDLSWSKDAVKRLLQAIEPAVKRKCDADGIVPGRAVKADLIFGQPQPID